MRVGRTPLKLLVYDEILLTLILPVNEIRGIFKELLDINDLISSSSSKQFLDDLVKQLLDMPWTIKGKYPILNILISRVGALYLIKTEPELLGHIYRAMRYYTSHEYI